MGFLDNIWKYILIITWRDAADIFIMSFFIYQLIRLISRTSAGRVMRGIVLVLAGFLLAEYLELTMFNFVLSNFIQVGLLAIVVVFQPELRKILEQMGTSNIKNIVARENVGKWEHTIKQTVEACKVLAWAREGALVVFERRVKLDDFIKTGTLVNADVTAELMRNIFYPKAPLHDGAAIIQEARISGAGCMLPLTNNQNLSRDLGMRHRAGIGISENTDSVVVIVSEESGSISVAVDGMLKRHLTPETLEQLLRKELVSDGEENKSGPLARVRSIVRGNRDEN